MKFRIPLVRIILLTVACLLSACGPSEDAAQNTLRLPPDEDVKDATPEKKPTTASGSDLAAQSFADARDGFRTRLIREENIGAPSPAPPPPMFELTQYDGPLGPMDAYIGRDPDPDNITKNPAIIWLVGGFSSSISELAWESGPRDNDQSAATFRKAGIVMMYPSLRGGNDNPGYHEGLCGEVDDVLSAAKHLATLEHVDPERIYLGGHSVGGTLALLAAAADPKRFRAAFSFGPIDDIRGYGQENLPFDIENSREAELRSPINWLADINCPTFAFEGEDGNVESLETLQKASENPLLRFFPVADADHFSVIRPVSELIAEKILGDIDSSVAANSAVQISPVEVDDRIAHYHAPPRPAYPSGRPSREIVSLEFGIYYTPSPGGKASPVETLKELISREYPELTWVDTAPEQVGDGWVTAFLNENVSDGYSPPSIESMRYFGRGISSEQAETLQTSEQALIVLLSHPQKNALDALRRANRLVGRIASETSGYPWDEETREIFTAEAWQKTRVESWNKTLPDISTQVTMHAFQDGDYLRAITLGMSKFGLADVMVDQFSRSGNQEVGNLINCLCQALVEGAAVDAQGNFELDLRSLRNASMREPHIENLSDGATGKVLLALKRGPWDLGDPVNSLIEIGFEHFDGPDLFAQQQAGLTQLFGSDDKVSGVKHNDELEIASAAARKKLPDLREHFQIGLAPGEVILVKSPFALPDDADNSEYMWVEVSKWQDDKITGILKSDPHHIPDLQAGQVVEVRQDTVFDYIHRLPDGESKGNTTGEIIRKMQEPGAK